MNLTYHTRSIGCEVCLAKSVWTLYQYYSWLIFAVYFHSRVIPHICPHNGGNSRGFFYRGISSRCRSLVTQKQCSHEYAAQQWLAPSIPTPETTHTVAFVKLMNECRHSPKLRCPTVRDRKKTKHSENLGPQREIPESASHSLITKYFVTRGENPKA